MDVLAYLFRGVCHQMADRALSAGNHVMPLCARCAGMYAGFFVALPVLLFRPGMFSRTVMRACTALACLAVFIWSADSGGNFFRLWDTPAAGRFAVGILLGISISPFVATLFVSTVRPVDVSGADGAGLKSQARGSRGGMGRMAVILLAALLVSVANVRPSPLFLAAQAWAAAAGLLALLAVVHCALLTLAFKRAKVPYALAISTMTAGGQVLCLSWLRAALSR